MLDHVNQQMISEAFDSFKQDIAQAPQKVALIAVSKKQSIDKMTYLYALGQRDFAESYCQEALPKMQSLPPDTIWHYIGQLQSRKCVEIARHFDWVQGVSRIKELGKLAQGAELANKRLNICIQVNIDNDPRKAGVHVDDLDRLVTEINAYPVLRLRGLMCILADSQDPNIQRSSFEKMRGLYQRLRKHFPDCDTLSMGMSGDYHIAVECGATMVRIGTALFGGR